MNETLEATLLTSFPTLYRAVPQPSFDGRFAFGDGWEFIIRRVSARLEPLVVRALVEDGLARGAIVAGDAEPLVYVRSVTKHLGRLSFALAGRGVTPAMRAAAAFAEHEALITCEDCGAPGTLVTVRDVHRTVCKRHLKALS